MLEDLQLHYGTQYCLAAALQDIHVNKEKAVAVQILAAKNPAFIGAAVPIDDTVKVTHAYDTISGYIQDKYNELAEVIKATSWRVLVQVGNIPDALDALIDNLRGIQSQVREKLAKSLNWIGQHLQALWAYVSKLVPDESWFSSLISGLSFNWLRKSVTAAIMYTARKFASALEYVFVTLRNLIYSGIGTMSDVLGGVMHALSNIPASKRAVVRALYFFASNAGDVARYVSHSYYKAENRLQAFKSQVVDVASDLITVAVSINAPDEFEKGVRESWYFGSSFGAAFSVAESVATWIFDYMSWFGNTLKRLVSSAKACFDATYTYALLFATVLGDQLESIVDYMQTWKDPISLIQARANVEELITNYSDRLSDESITRLRRSIDVADVVIEDLQQQNDFVVNSRDNLKHSAQYEMNHKAADLLTAAYYQDEDIDVDAARAVVKFYGGKQDLVDRFAINRETLTFLEAQYTLAIDELLDLGAAAASTEPISGPTRVAGPKADEDQEKPIYELQQQLALADQDFQLAKVALEEFEQGLESGLVRDAKYLTAARNLEKMLESNSTKLDIFVAEPEIKQMALMIVEQKEGPSHADHFTHFQNLYRAYYERNRLAKILKTKLEPADSRRYYISIAAVLIAAALPLTMYGLLYWKGTPAPVFVDEGVAWRWIQRIPYVGVATSTVSIVGGLNLGTWVNIIDHFQEASAAKVLDLPRLFQYFSVLITAIPVTISFAMYTYFAITCFGSMIIDALYDIGIKERDANGKIVFTRNRFWYYLGIGTRSANAAFTYGFYRVVTLWIGLVTAQVDAVKSIAGSLPTLLGAANPVGFLMEGAAGLTPTKKKLKERLKQVNLLPSDSVVSAIMKPEGVESQNPLLPYATIVDVLQNLSKDHPLLTGAHVLTRVRERQTRTGGGGATKSLPSLKGKDDSEDDVDDFLSTLTVVKRT